MSTTGSNVQDSGTSVGPHLACLKPDESDRIGQSGDELTSHAAEAAAAAISGRNRFRRRLMWN
jgi:hypothetical protein